MSSCGSKRCAAIEKEVAAQRYCLMVPDLIARHKIVFLLPRSDAYTAKTKFLSLSLREDNTALGSSCLSTNFNQCACLGQNVLAECSWFGPDLIPRTRPDKLKREARDLDDIDDMS